MTCCCRQRPRTGTMRVAVLVAAAALCACAAGEDSAPAAATDREERLFPKDGLLFVRETSQTKLTIQTVPSSCVVVEPSLPPCRGLRAFKLQPSPTTRLEMTEAPRVLSWQTEQPDHKVQQGQSSSLLPSKADIADVLSRWGSYLGLPPLVTTRVHETGVTRRVFDPSVMITFSVVGCRPTRLPFELPHCRRDGPTVSLQDPPLVGDQGTPSTTEVIVESSG